MGEEDRHRHLFHVHALILIFPYLLLPKQVDCEFEDTRAPDVNDLGHVALYVKPKR